VKRRVLFVVELWATMNLSWNRRYRGSKVGMQVVVMPMLTWTLWDFRVEKLVRRRKE